MKGVQYMSDYEIPLAIGVLKGISWVSSYYNTGLLLFNIVSSNYKVDITEPHLCSKYTKITLDHDIPGAIGVLIGIS